MDNFKGYIIGNCIPACKICNQAKHTMSKDEFLDWIKRIYHHNFGGNNV